MHIFPTRPATSEKVYPVMDERVNFGYFGSHESQLLFLFLVVFEILFSFTILVLHIVLFSSEFSFLLAFARQLNLQKYGKFD